MVKRPKSPEPIEDSKFLAVVHPFPLNANMDVPNDFKEFMYWLASIAGKDYALGVYYKPSARGMVIAEVSKLYRDFDKLLGEHRWVEFLYKVSTEERERKTRVFYSTYPNGRALQKDGWKYILADDALFSEFRPINRKIKHPYPTPHWCDVPYEDPTNKVICRPLPVSSKAPPPKPVAPVPGSSTWISRKTGGRVLSSASEEQSKGGVAKKGKGKVSTNPDSWKTPITSPTTSKSPTTPTATTPSVSNPAKSAWAKPLGPITTSTLTPRSISPASATAGTETTVASPTSPPTALPISHPLTSPPPGLTPPGLPPARPTNPVGSSSVAVLQNQFAAASIVESGFNSDGDFDEGDDGDGEFEFPTASVVTPRDDPSQPSPGTRVFSSNAPRAGKGGNILPVAPPAPTKGRNQKEDRPENLWSKVPQTAGRTFRKVVEEDEMCPVHGIVCSKGICSVMKKRKWEKEKTMKREEREREREARRRAKAAEEGNDNFDVAGEGEGEGEGENGEGEVGEEDVKSRSGSSVSAATGGRGKKSEDGFTIVGSARTGDWGGRKARNAKKKGMVPDDDSAVLSSARPTHGSASSNTSQAAPPSIASLSAATATVSSATERQIGTNTINTPAPSSLSGSVWSSRKPGVKANGVDRKSNGGGSVNKDVNGRSVSRKGEKEETMSRGGKGTATTTAAKTWDEMMDDGDDSELGSIMDFHA